MDDSPITTLLEAIDRLDIEAATAPFSSAARVLTADGRHAEGVDAARALIADYLGGLRSTSHRITAQWHPDDVWIAEVEADYELKDWSKISGLPRVFIVREGSDGIAELRVYGAHEHALADHPTGEGGMWIGERLIPPL